MCKKFFHPTAKHNIKKVWMREQELSQLEKEETEAVETFKRYCVHIDSFKPRIVFLTVLAKNTVRF